MSDNNFIVGRSEGVAYANNNLQYSQFKMDQIHNKEKKIKLTQKHFNVIGEAIAKLDCYSCEFINECYKSDKPICAEIDIWLSDNK